MSQHTKCQSSTSTSSNKMQILNLFEVGEKTLETITKNYNRNEETIREDVIVLKEWMKSQPHLPEILDDTSIRNFLILNKCSIEKSKQRIDTYYTIRSLIPDMYENINPKLPNMTQFMEIAYWVPLPKLTDEMYRVLVFKMRNKSMIDVMEPHNVLGHAFNLQEVRLKEDIMFGDICIFDMDGLTLGYLTKLTPTVIAKILAIYERVFSIPMKAMYVLNTPPFINTILAIMKSLMKPKLFQRIHLCEDTSILRERFPKEMIPEDYGGEAQSLEALQGILKEKFVAYQNRFDHLDKLRVNEKLRPSKLENDEILGFHGNFKKLSVD